MPEIRFIIMADGRVQVMVDETAGGFEEAAALSQSAIARLQAMGVPIQATDQPEQHKPDVRHVHLVEHQRHRVGGAS